jgi:serine/threonine protein kinase
MVPGDTGRVQATALDEPFTFGRYRLVSRIGIGGMAEVFRGVVQGPEGWERELVVKRILPDLSGNPKFRRLFIREAKISALLMHPNIVQIYEFGEADGTYFLAMEIVHGVTLRAAMARLKREERAMPFMVAADIARQVCTGLDHAHGLRTAAGVPLQIVHQDISPTNVMLAYNGTAKLLDFGIARAAAFAEGEVRAGLIAGKVSYLAPEQLDLRPFDHRIDIFALGAVLHETLTGLRLFPAKNDIGRMKQMLGEPIPPPSTVNAAVPRELDRIVMKALAIDPAERYQTAGAMAADLERTLIAARYSSRDLSKLLGGLFLPPEEPRVVVEGQPPPVASAPTAPAGHPASPTDRMRPVARARPPRDAIEHALPAERARLVWQIWRGRIKVAAGTLAVGTALGAIVLVAKQYGPLLLALPPAPAAEAVAVSPPAEAREPKPAAEPAAAPAAPASAAAPAPAPAPAALPAARARAGKRAAR